MAEETEKSAAPKPETPEKPGRAPKKKKSRPTNCAQSNKRIRRKDWYYRNGKYFANKKAFKIFLAQETEKAKKAESAAAQSAAAPSPAADAAGSQSSTA
ncbi:MAG: hypothetical protein HYZ87_04765 [Candidatus Omnitrophica bacterium]|nr:hypothetical protein [Candidatus Omnitrophota bacterium]